MARARKKRFQLLRTIVLGALVFIITGMIAGGIAQSVLIFMLTGYITGTTIIVPVWGMFALYLGIIAFIGLTYYLDHELEQHYLRKHQASRKLPRRRYSHI